MDNYKYHNDFHDICEGKTHSHNYPILNPHRGFLFLGVPSFLFLISAAQIAIGMASMSRPDFNANTEGVEVTKEFADSIRGKTVLVTGVNLNGIGFSTSQAIVCLIPFVTLRLMTTLRRPLNLRPTSLLLVVVMQRSQIV